MKKPWVEYGTKLHNIRRVVIKGLMKLVENELSIDDYPILKLAHMDTTRQYSQEEQEKIMFEASNQTYLNEMQHPWDLYFGLDLSHLLKGQRVLDLGCANGGRSIAWAERYGLNQIYGLDILSIYAKAAQNYANMKGIKGEFVCSKGENLPFKDEEFDAIVSFDVFEHVQDVKQVLLECKRVLKKGGHLFVVFPGFLHPYEHHLSPVTLTPFIHYFFPSRDLIEVYNEIIERRGTEKTWWYRRQNPGLEPWEQGNTINGTTRDKFRKLINDTSWSVYSEHKLPFMKTLGERLQIFKLLRYIIYPFAQLKGFDEILCERITYILEKPS
jgi:ubiquinone/menaquinone biosynthesis C-methylase UbiE